jgi:hypothetical protein
MVSGNRRLAGAVAVHPNAGAAGDQRASTFGYGIGWRKGDLQCHGLKFVADDI